MLILRRFAAALVAASLAAAGAAAAAEPKKLADSQDWSAYVIEDGGSKVCYVFSSPKKAEGDYTQRGDIYALVTHRPSDKMRDVVSIVTGYTYKPNSDVEIDIGGRKFTLFVDGDTAWADDEDDPKLVAAMRAGASMVVRGISSRGTLTTDTYSLSGFTAAHNAIGKACP